MEDKRHKSGDPVLYRTPENGFTLIELLVVIAIIALLLAIITPALKKAKDAAKAVTCGTRMRQWAIASTMYSNENDDEFCYEATDDYYANPGGTLMWFQLLAPYISYDSGAGAEFWNNDEIWIADIRRCPSGKTDEPGWTQDDCWIGVHFSLGASTGAPKSPFFPRIFNAVETPPLKVTGIKSPAMTMGFMETIAYYVYSPNENAYRFNEDTDDDGFYDTNNAWASIGEYYNDARPKVHSGASNVGLLDGHVEKIKYEKLWKVDAGGNTQHPFWRLIYH